MRKTIFLGLLLFFLFCKVGLVFAESSAMFRITETVPPSAQAGKEVAFVVRITNTGMETWVSGEYSVFVKIYDINKNYLTETDKVRQIVEIEPGGSFSASVEFKLPPDYVGIHYYTVNLEIEDKGTFESRYFRFEVSPFRPEPEEEPRYTGSFRVGYQAISQSSPSSNFNLSLLNRIDPERYRTLAISGKDLGLASFEISSFTVSNLFLTSHGEEEIELRAGNISSSLSSLTVNKLRGLKVGASHGKVYLAGLVGENRDPSSDNQSRELKVYGVKVVTDLTDVFSLGVNFLGKMQSETAKSISEVASEPNSALSLEMDYDLGSNLTLAGEYARSFPYGEAFQSSAQESDAFHVKGSFDAGKIYLDGSYKRVGKNFTLPGNEKLKKDYLQGALFLDYSLSRYLNAGLSYYSHISHPFEENNKLISITKSFDLSFRRPDLPLLILSYDIDEMEGTDSSLSFLVNDVTYTLRGVISYPFRKTRFTLGYFSSHYEDKTESGLEDDFSLLTYKVSTKLGKRLSISATQKIEEKTTNVDEGEISPVFSLATTYTIIPNKLTLSSSWSVQRKEKEEDNQTTTRATLRYIISRSNILEYSYGLKNYGTFTNLDMLISEERKAVLRWRFNLGENQGLDVSYIFSESQDSSQDKTSNTSSINLTYNYTF